jgi:hypothetical protein
VPASQFSARVINAGAPLIDAVIPGKAAKVNVQTLAVFSIQQ